MLKHQGHNSRSNNHYNAYTYCNTEWYPHFHKSFELLYVLKGELSLNVNERTTALTQGQFALILSNQIHSFTVDARSLVWVAVFSEDFVPEFASFVKDKRGSEVGFFADDEVAELLIGQMILGAPTNMMRRACLLAICDQYSKKVSLEEYRGKNDRLICRVLDYIAEHYTENVSMQAIAEAFGYEYHYLSRLLNRGYNIRFRKILNEYRVEAAIRELEKGERGITEIALSCGFQSIRSFNDVFYGEMGVSPSEYRALDVSKRRNCKKTVNNEVLSCIDREDMV
ncbi:MAG: helix-turn-helix domain-containing protein [Clostridia bacterium]|nr:helix-turn-helix domain-containing protein [Clostridia bacterium]